ARGVATDANGNVYVTGFTGGVLGTMSGVSPGLSDIILIKYDADGQKQWARQVDAAAGEAGLAVSLDTSGNIYVAGQTDGDFDSHTNAGADDSLLIKFDRDGQAQWSAQLGSSDTDSATAVALDMAGNVYVAGTTHGNLDG